MVTRYELLEILGKRVTDELVVTNIGAVAREWYHIKERDGNLYPVYMSGATPQALGLALAVPHRKVIGLDCDGAVLMGLTALPALAEQDPKNLTIIVFDNEVYGDAGRVPTFTARASDLAGIARSSGIRNAITVRDAAEFTSALDASNKADGATYIVAKVETGYAAVPYAAFDGFENKYRFIRYVERTENIKIIKPAAKRI